jgi:hypothetical protein
MLIFSQNLAALPIIVRGGHGRDRHSHHGYFSAMDTVCGRHGFFRYFDFAFPVVTRLTR